MCGEGEGQLHPLWREAACLDGRTFYLNPSSGQLSRTRFPAPAPVPGGILADEMVRHPIPYILNPKHCCHTPPCFRHSMAASVALSSARQADQCKMQGASGRSGCVLQGMGKTVELLACILAHRFQGPCLVPDLYVRLSPASELRAHAVPTSGGVCACTTYAKVLHTPGLTLLPLFSQEVPKRERIECVCGFTGSEEGKGLWVQCDGCLAWLHGTCVALKSPPQGALSVS